MKGIIEMTNRAKSLPPNKKKSKIRWIICSTEVLLSMGRTDKAARSGVISIIYDMPD
jgi:hypothetical protein